MQILVRRAMRVDEGRGVLFTDRERSEATVRPQDHWLVVVGNLEFSPLAKDDHGILAGPSLVA